MDKTLELIALSQNGDADAKERLVIENAGLVWSVVRRFANRGYEFEDLFQIGSIGLIKCIDKFDASYGVKFSTYAVPMIMGEIKRHLRDDGIIKISRPLKEMAVKAKYMQETLQHATGKEPTIVELADALNTTSEELVMALETGFDIESLDSVVYQSDGNPVLLIDKLEQYTNESDSLADTITLRNIISHLEPKERQVIIMRYFRDKTQSEVARIIGVSQVQISRIEKKILRLMREQFMESS